MNNQSIDKLSEAIAFAETVGPLPRCPHGSALRDGAGEALEPPCGCRAVDSGTEVTQPVLHGRVGGENRLITEQCGFCGAAAGQPCIEIEFESVGTEVAKKPACPSCCADWIAKGYNVPGELCPQCSLRPRVGTEVEAKDDQETKCPHGTAGTCAICESADWAVRYRLERKRYPECTHAVPAGATCQLCPDPKAINRLQEYNEPPPESTESSPQSEEGVESETGWCLEKMMKGNVYYITVDQMLTWTDDPLKALRLARREDADMLCEIVEDADKVAEHEWVGPATRTVNSSAQQNQDQESGEMLQLYDAACRAGLSSAGGRSFEEWLDKVSDYGLDDARQALLGEMPQKAPSLSTAVENGEAPTVGLSANPERDWSIGDVIAAYPDGTIVLDDGLTTWNDIRAKEFLDKADEAAFDLMDEVQHRMDAVVDAAVAWCESGEEGESVADSFEKGEALSNAVYRLKQLRSKPVTCDQPSQPEISSSQVVKEAWACIWEENIDAVWQTSCGNAYQFTDGGPSDNRAEYCIYCGKPISELALADEQETKDVC